MLWLGTFAFIGAYAIRGAAWWPLAAVVAVAGVLVTAPSPHEGRLSAMDPRDSPLIRRVNLIVVGVIALAAVALLPTWRPVEPATGAPSLGDTVPGSTPLPKTHSATATSS